MGYQQVDDFAKVILLSQAINFTGINPKENHAAAKFVSYLLIFQ